jgi:hypothetical protein
LSNILSGTSIQDGGKNQFFDRPLKGFNIFAIFFLRLFRISTTHVWWEK